MNQKQRDFLINKMTGTITDKIDELKKKIGSPPLIDGYLYAEIMSGSLKLKSTQEQKKLITDHVKKLKRDSAITARDSHSFGRGRDNDVTFLKVPYELLIEMPIDYLDRLDEWEERKHKINIQIDQLNSQLETTILRVQMSSDKVLQGIIADIDDFGDMKLMDTKIKSLLLN